MIFVERSDSPPELVGPTSAGEQEILTWSTYFDELDAGGDPEEPRNFSVYKRARVRQTLETMFVGKCAYCESEILSVAHGDIEHWRPKKAVRGVDNHRGYWWLAARWENLLLSCTLCNQLPGKGTKFPIANEMDRATQPGEEEGERPLLLNPCVDHPEAHLAVKTVFEDGKLRPLLKAIDPPGADPKGGTTIDTFLLNRVDLVGQRARLFRRLEELQMDIRRLLRNLDADPAGPNAADNREWLRQKLADLNKLRGEDQEFRMLAQQIIEPFLSEIGAQ